MSDRQAGNGRAAAGTYVELLGRDACVELLGSAPVGWLAFCDGETPRVVPVNFAVDGDEVVVRAKELAIVIPLREVCGRRLHEAAR